MKRSKSQKTRRNQSKDYIDDFELVELNRRKKATKNHRRRMERD